MFSSHIIVLKFVFFSTEILIAMSKVVLITGGSSGIGKSIGEFLKTKGFIVYGTSRNPEKYTIVNFLWLLWMLQD